MVPHLTFFRKNMKSSFIKTMAAFAVTRELWVREPYTIARSVNRGVSSCGGAV